MLDKVQRRMTPEEFYAWQEGMDERYELVDGYPVPRCPDIYMMTGASRRHDQIVSNAIRHIGNQLEDNRCRTFTADTAVRTMKGTRRRPDAGVECGEIDDRSFEAGEVRMVVEVLSPSTHEIDMFAKLDEYKAIETIDHILLVEPNAPHVILWSRGADRNWTHAAVEGIDATVEIKSLDIALRLVDLYAGLTFRPVPKLMDASEG
jgi:Uma2 family endonuclease